MFMGARSSPHALSISGLGAPAKGLVLRFLKSLGLYVIVILATAADVLSIPIHLEAMSNLPCDESSSAEFARMTIKLIAAYSNINPTWMSMLRLNSHLFLLSPVVGRLPEVSSDGSSSSRGMGAYVEHAICALSFLLRKFHLISTLALGRACKKLA